MKGNYSVAVLMSSYNGEKYIGQQIKSILSQKLDGGNLHLFIRDDGSTDGTFKIIKEYEKIDDRITILPGENRGYIASFFMLLYEMKNSATRFDFYSLADQDDVWESDKIQAAVDMLREYENVPVLYQSVTSIVDEHLNFLRNSQACCKEISIFNSLIQTFSPGHTYVLNYCLLEKVPLGIEFNRLYGHDAYLTNLAVLQGKIIFDNESHVLYRQHGKNQLGASIRNDILGWLKMRVKRIFNGDSKKYAQQIEYIYDSLGDLLTKEEKEELKKFLLNRRSFRKRLMYIFTTKLYRQRKVETFLFKVLYLFGGYNV